MENFCLKFIAFAPFSSSVWVFVKFTCENLPAPNIVVKDVSFSWVESEKGFRVMANFRISCDDLWALAT
jgi:hypothetical protein